MGSSRKPHFCNGNTHEFDFDFAEQAVLANLAAAHLRVGSSRSTFKPFALDRSGRDNLFSYFCTARSRWAVGQFVEWDRWDLDVYVNSV